MRIALALVIVLTAAAVAGIAYLFIATPPTASTATPPRAVAPAGEVRPPVPLSPATNAVVKPAPFDWRRVETPEYRDYVTRLRAIGCPEESVRELVRADVAKRFEERRAALGGGTRRFEYWRSGNPLPEVFEPAKVSAQQALAREERQLLSALLGVDALSSSTEAADAEAVYAALLAFLAPEKRSRVIGLEESFAGKADAGSYAEKEMRLKKLLNPEEKFEYDLRLSPTAMRLRVQMGDFQPTEPEFRELFRVRQRFEEDFGAAGPAATDAKLAPVARPFDDEMKRVLGESRWAEYRKEQQWAQSPLRLVATEYQVPKATALQVFSLKSGAEERAEKIRANPWASNEHRLVALKTIREETEREVSRILGSEAAMAYLNRDPWVRRLEEVAGTNATPTPVP